MRRCNVPRAAQVIITVTRAIITASRTERRTRKGIVYSASGLHDHPLRAHRLETVPYPYGLRTVGEGGLHGDPHLMSGTTLDEQVEAVPGPGPATRHPGDHRVAVGVDLHVQAHPVEFWDKPLQAFGVDPRGVQAHLEPKCRDLVERGLQCRLQRRFASREDHGIQQAAAVIIAVRL